MARWLTIVAAISLPLSSQVAPGVVSLVPAANGEVEWRSVPELIISFDMDMSPASHSFVGGGPSFPKVRGRPRWKDARTCILPVELTPDGEYVIGLNSASHTGFRSESGVPLAPVIWTFSTFDATRVRPIEEQRARNAAAIDRLRMGIERRYSYRDRVVSDWESLWRDGTAALRDARTDLGFVRRAAALLEVAADRHLTLAWNGQVRATMPQGVDALFRRPLVERDVTLRAAGPSAAVAETADGITYLLIESWERGLDLTPIEAALAGARASRALILDVRPNRGGDESLAATIAGWFVTGDHAYAQHRRLRLDGAERVFEPTETRRIRGHEAPRQFAGPVALLTGPAVGSSNESFVLMMRCSKNVRVLGQTTCGSSGNPQPWDLGNGVIVRIPSWQALRADGSTLEGVGLAPDTLVPWTPTPSDASDPVLRRALDSVRSRLR